MAVDTLEQNQALVRWVTFRLAGELYGINVMQVKEVLKQTEVSPVPGAPNYVLGIINLRGNVVTVIDTRRKFGLEHKDADDSMRVVIIESDQQMVIGLLVDSVAEVVNLNNADIEASPNVGTEESSKYISGVAMTGEELLILCDVNRLLADTEWKEIALL